MRIRNIFIPDETNNNLNMHSRTHSPTLYHSKYLSTVHVCAVAWFVRRC